MLTCEIRFTPRFNSLEGLIITTRKNSLNLLLTATLAVIVIRFWLMPMPSSFWVDEMGTVFVVHHGASDPSLRAAPQVADSIYYALPALAEKLLGFSEISYRLFSLLAMGGSLFVIARIASRCIHPEAAWFAVFACLSSRNFNYQAADARPYALGTFILSCAVYLLIRWLDSGRARDAALFAAPAILLWWVHLIFWPFYLIFGIYAGVRIFVRETAAGWAQILVTFTVVGAGILPVALRALSLLHAAASHVIVAPPVLADLSLQLKIAMLTGLCSVAFLLGRYFHWEFPQPVSVATLALAAGWWLIDPVAVYGFSRLTANSIFVPRYMFLAIPGVSLAATLILAMTVPANLWKKCALGLGIAVLVFGGHWGHFWLPHQDSNWKAAAQTLKQWTADENVPVICPSPFIEARPPVWRPDYPVSGFLYSHLAVYPMSGHVIPFPFETSPEAESYAAGLSASTLSGSTLSAGPRFAIYGGDLSVKFWRKWFSSQPSLQDWSSRVLGTYGDVQVVVFEKRRPMAYFTRPR